MIKITKYLYGKVFRPTLVRFVRQKKNAVILNELLFTEVDEIVQLEDRGMIGIAKN